MMKHKHVVATVISAIALLVPGLSGTAALAAESTSTPAVAVRSFPAQRAAQKSDLLAEAQSVTASKNSKWGGVESLSVPKTKSDAERQQDERAQVARTQAASRSNQRRDLNVTNQQSTGSSTVSSQSASSQSANTTVEKPSSKSAQSLAQFAQQFTNVPYVWGGTTPAGWDCSGFTMWIFSQFGVKLPRLAADQRAYAQAHGQRHSVPQVGDLMAMNDGSHMAIYLGNGMMMHAPLPGMMTQIIPVYSPNFEYYGML